MSQNENEYVWLDGMLLKEEHLMKLAMNVGNYALAEHYLCALLAHGVVYGKQDIINKVNEVREFYNVPPIPLADNEISRGRCRKGDTSDDKARARFKKMALEERRRILMSSLSLLRSNYHMFTFARHWFGVYLVIRDRLEGEKLNRKNFIEYAQSIMPSDWPKKLSLGVNVYKNFSREMDYSNRCEAYYDLDECPQKELCDTLWDIIKQMILTTI